MALPKQTGNGSGKKHAFTPADGLRGTRAAHAREIAEDYVEAIAELTERTGEARVTDLAQRLGVTHVTVNRTIARLQRGGYVTSQPYRAIFLTDIGKKLAVESKQRHEVVVQYLRSIGVPEHTAQLDAEGIEHHVSPETLTAFQRQLRKL